MKRAYVFLLDAVFAVGILMIGYMLLSSQGVQETSEFPISHIPESTIDVLTVARVDQMCTVVTQGSCDCSDAELERFCNENNLRFHNSSLTVLDYFGELYEQDKHISNTNDLEDLFESVTSEAIDQDLYGVEFAIEGDTIYEEGTNRAESSQLISAKRIIIGYYEEPGTGEVTFWGPYTAEVNVWKE